MNQVNLTIQINASIEVAHLDQINAYFAGMEKMLKALPNGSIVNLIPSNGNGHESGKEVTSANSHQGRHPE